MFRTLMLVVTSVSTAAMAHAEWVWTSFDYPGSFYTIANGVSGDTIVGSYTDSSGAWHGYLHNGTAWTTLDGPGASKGTSVYGVDGNNVVGWYADDASKVHGFLYNGATFTPLSYPGATETYPRGISGTKIVGLYGAPGGSHGFLYDGTTWTTLDYPGAEATSPLGIRGDTVCGTYRAASNVYRGFLYDGSTWTSFDYPLAAPYIAVCGFDGGNIVGTWQWNQEHGFLWDGTTWTALDYPGPTTTTTVTGIEGNRIIGYYLTMSGYQHGFVLTIPEPATLLLLALGGLVVMRRRTARSRRGPA